MVITAPQDGVLQCVLRISASIFMLRMYLIDTVFDIYPIQTTNGENGRDHLLLIRKAALANAAVFPVCSPASRHEVRRREAPKARRRCELNEQYWHQTDSDALCSHLHRCAGRCGPDVLPRGNQRCCKLVNELKAENKRLRRSLGKR
jgi:hypothetical protein